MRRVNSRKPDSKRYGAIAYFSTLPETPLNTALKKIRVLYRQAIQRATTW